jgi:pimeloyl-ACP methyl ester carboxylesterase
MQRRPLLGAAAAAAVTNAAGEAPAQQAPAAAREPVALADWGSFHVGGRLVPLSGRPVREVVLTPGGAPARIDPNGEYMVGAMYAQYMIPANRRGAAPLLMWHGGGLTGVSWETTPDGREGWQHFFLRRGWATYVSDAMERGRSGWAMFPDLIPGEPSFLPVANPWERFRIGDGQGSYARGTALPGVLFPTDRESYLNFTRQIVPRFLTTDQMILDAYLALLDRVGPSVVMVHSQAGQFGWRAAQERPHLVRALVLVEPAATGAAEKAAALKDIPQLVVYGDYIDHDARWPTLRRNGMAFVERVRAAGGTVEVMDLPTRGVRGNSHMIMMDRNSDQVAGMTQDWLAAKGLWT